MLNDYPTYASSIETYGIDILLPLKLVIEFSKRFYNFFSQELSFVKFWIRAVKKMADL